MQSLMSTDLKKPEKKKESKIETRFYDDLFLRLQDKNSEEFKDPEAVENLYNNIIDQISEDTSELVKCLNSFHIDYFIYRSNTENFLKIFKLLVIDNEKLEEYISDRRISRAYEACLTFIGEKFSKSTVTDDQIDLAKQCLKSLGNFLVENFESILDTENGIFTLRCFFRILGKKDCLEPAPNQNNKNKKNKWQRTEFNIRDIEVKVLPESWKIKKFLKKFSLEDINLLEKGLIPAVSPCLSLFMRKLYDCYPVASAELIESIHKQFVKKSSSFHSMIQDSIGSRFIESYLYCCPIELLHNYYLETHLLPNITMYCNHIYANYPIQSLIKYRLESETKLVVLYESILENLDSIIDLHTDLIYKNYLIIELITACSKSEDLELKKLVKILMNYFGCESDEDKADFLRIILCYEKIDDIKKETPVDQAMFVFDLKPIATRIVAKLIEYNDKNTIKCFNNLNANEMEHLCTNNVGSHLIQECARLFNAKERTENLAQIYDKLKGRFLILATNRSGSFVMETLWSLANLKQRIAIADELKTSEVQLKNDQYAKYLMNNIGISFYKRKPAEWKQIQTNEFKKRKMLADLIDESATDNNKKIKAN